MRFYQCECANIWLPRKGETQFVCPKCGSRNTKVLKDVTAFQCKNRNGNGLIFLNSDGSKSEIRLNWEDFNRSFTFVDTDKFWIERKVG
jgi:predicted RNA-binding Zn-ribbon protein involved in translation (DUF1610 family)